MKDAEGRMLRKKEAVKRRLIKYFENLIKVKSEWEVVVICTGIIGCAGNVHEEEEIKRRHEANGKAAGVDGIRTEMLKYGGETMIEWMHMICRLAWEEGKVPQQNKKRRLMPWLSPGDSS